MTYTAPISTAIQDLVDVLAAPAVEHPCWAPAGASRLVFNEDGSLRSYYDASGTKQFTVEGQKQWNAHTHQARTHLEYEEPAGRYSGGVFDYTIWK